MAIGSSGDVGRVRSPVSDLTSIKVRLAVIVHTVHQSLVVKTVGQLAPLDRVRLSASLHGWLGL